jgi:hypothetical protein
MGSTVSSEKPKAVSLAGVAESIRSTRAAGQKVLLVGGPAIVHTGSVPHVGRLIRDGWVQTLFAGRCEKPGVATYGRWSQQTLRLVPGRVEISGDNRRFRPLVDQAAGCAIPNIG